jgi:two-component system cell cycle sensor histidine kinase/response regulator CckA
VTILLAEDEPAILRATKRALEGKGYTVLLAEDGEQALALFREHRSEIELVISDVEMPKLGGAELATAICAEADDVRLLIMSGRSPAEMTASGGFPERVGFLQKPWTLDDLYVRVREALSEA